MGDLKKYFTEYSVNGGRAIYKHLSYAFIYEEILSKYRGKDIVLVEIGIGYGGCLQVWKAYLGSKAKIYGIEKESHLAYEEEQIKCFIGNQGDRDFLKELKNIIPNIDILIDDGSHFCSDQIASFEELFLHLNPGGIYVCEDTHTSYRELYGGAYKKEGTFIEYCKNLIDSMYHTEDPRIPINDFCNIIYSISFYSAMVVIRKTGGEDNV